MTSIRHVTSRGVDLCGGDICVAKVRRWEVTYLLQLGALVGSTIGNERKKIEQIRGYAQKITATTSYHGASRSWDMKAVKVQDTTQHLM